MVCAPLQPRDIRGEIDVDGGELRDQRVDNGLREV